MTMKNSGSPCPHKPCVLTSVQSEGIPLHKWRHRKGGPVRHIVMDERCRPVSGYFYYYLWWLLLPRGDLGSEFFWHSHRWVEDHHFVPSGFTEFRFQQKKSGCIVLFVGIQDYSAHKPSQTHHILDHTARDSQTQRPLPLPFYKSIVLLSKQHVFSSPHQRTQLGKAGSDANSGRWICRYVTRFRSGF